MNDHFLWIKLSYALIIAITTSTWQRNTEVANKYLCIQQLVSGPNKNVKHESSSKAAE